jgi:hypothetical protein
VEQSRTTPRNGTIASLPSRVSLAPPFGAASSLLDVAALYGNICALAQGGLDRLDSDGTPAVGRLIGVPVSASASAPMRGRLHNDDTSISLVAGNGQYEVFRATCAP